MPNSAHLHLLLNHFPVIGTAGVLIFLLYAFASKNEKLKKFSLLVIILISLITIPVFVSGNNAQGIVKGAEGIVEDNIPAHENFANKSFLAMEILGAFALAGLALFRKDKNIPLWFSAVIFVLLLTVNGMMVYTSSLGGKITHYEIINKGK